MDEQEATPLDDLPNHLEQHRSLFLNEVAGLRPQLHRFCTRMSGSVLIVQEVLMQTFYKLPSLRDVSRLRRGFFASHITNASIAFVSTEDWTSCWRKRARSTSTPPKPRRPVSGWGKPLPLS